MATPHCFMCPHGSPPLSANATVWNMGDCGIAICLDCMLRHWVKKPSGDPVVRCAWHYCHNRDAGFPRLPSIQESAFDPAKIVLLREQLRDDTEIMGVEAAEALTIADLLLAINMQHTPYLNPHNKDLYSTPEVRHAVENPVLEVVKHLQLGKDPRYTTTVKDLGKELLEEWDRRLEPLMIMYGQGRIRGMEDAWKSVILDTTVLLRLRHLERFGLRGSGTPKSM
ncbi:hypothetical protein BDV95DRAFT_655408 [Massariosphaeria phaeospora]|uniref:Uncharacterized protein n=1 Tax=Massariosphaeria phaeospora TaxID=100035 RepID=A0A7C8MB88_9PLEO|nr:hypothetical protein BDV95DRAFT_655408 [Massariosphaeria phaeospora]